MFRTGEGYGTPLQYSCLENPMDGGAWWAAVHRVAQSRTRLSNFTFTFHFHALDKEIATHSSVLAWRIPGMGKPGGLQSLGSHRVRHGWSNLAAAAAACLNIVFWLPLNCFPLYHLFSPSWFFTSTDIPIFSYINDQWWTNYDHVNVVSEWIRGYNMMIFVYGAALCFSWNHIYLSVLPEFMTQFCIITLFQMSGYFHSLEFLMLWC